MMGLAVGGWFASAFIGKLADKLRSYIGDQYEYQTSSIKDKLKTLEGNMTKIQATIHAADQRHIENPGLKKWLLDLKDACYDAEDVLDIFEYQVLEDKAKGKNQRSSNFATTSRKLSKKAHTIVKRFLFHDDDLNKLLKVVDTFNKLVNQMGDFLHLLNLDSAAREKGESCEIMEWRLTDSDFKEPELFGRHNEKAYMIKLLLEKEGDEGGPNRKIVHVLPMVGVGGVGKTTLAQSVYNEQSVQQFFDLTAWVCISDKFELRRLITEIIESASIEKPRDFYNIKSLDKIRQILKKGLMGKRFLIILDDVWDEKRDKWENLRSIFESGKDGSKVVVTTRNHKIADMMGTKEAMTLGSLADKDYWNFFVQCTFGDENPENYPDLVFFGRKIVKKLGGLPLAAKVVGAVLKSNLKEQHWKEISESKVWQIDQHKDGIMPVLRLSYEYLPAHLKQCFVYCSLFPKDYGFSKKILVRLWMAQGFIQPNQENTLEMMGKAYFSELLSRSFFQKTTLKHYVIHDLLHDLAEYLSDGESFRAEDNLSENKPDKIPKKVRHAYISANNLSLVCNDKHAKKHLRSLMVVGDSDISLDILRELKGLRVLILEVLNQKLSSEFFQQMSHLRYLEIGYSNQKYELPESLCKLYHLQVLSVGREFFWPSGRQFFWPSETDYYAILPKGINRLINLRHLAGYTGKTAGIGTLTSLQALKFRVDKKESGFEIRQLRDMSQLRRLWIAGLESVESKEQASEAKLSDKRSLKKLRLEWGTGSHITNPDGVLEGLEPHPNLKLLEISGYSGKNCPCWWTGNWLSYLNHIELTNCSSWEILPPMGQLPLLKVLVLERMDAVKRIGPEFYGSSNNTKFEAFPSLKQLFLHGMFELTEWCNRVEGLELFPRLSSLAVNGCPNLRGLVCLPSPLRLLFIRITEKEFGFLCPKEWCNISCPSISRLIEWIPWQNLASVEIMEIEADEMTTFPTELKEWLQHLTSLRSLHFDCFYELQPSASSSIQADLSLHNLSLY